MPSGLISERLNSHNHSRNTGFLAKDKLEEFRQTFCSTLAELAQQLPVVGKDFAQDFGNGKNVLTMGDWIKNHFLGVMTELNHLLGMEGGTKPSASTRKCQNVFVIAIRASYPGEAFAEITAIEVFANYMRNDRPIKTLLLREEFVIALLELEKVMIEKLPQRGLLRFPSPVYFDLAAVFHTAPLLPARELS